MCTVFPSGLQKGRWFAGFCWKPKVEPGSAQTSNKWLCCWLEPRRTDWRGFDEKDSEENAVVEGDVQAMESN
jgi:hypothetical protein